MIGKDILTRHKCSSVNYRTFFHLKYFMKGKSIICCTCHTYSMDLKYWTDFKVEYMLNQMMIFSLFARTVELVNNV